MIMFVVIVSSVFAAIGQLLLKWGAAGNTTVLAFVNLYVVSGLAAFIVSTTLWLYALAHEKLSVVYPFTVLSFVLVYCASYFVLNEDLSGRALAGAVLVLAGLCLIVAR